ncbi:hypothetical protein [Streptomyces sp. NPDC001889]
MPTEQHEPRLQALAVNVGKRWSEVAAGLSTEGDVVLSAWSPWRGGSTTSKLFDPDRIAVLVACRRGETMAVYDVTPDAAGERWHWVGDEPRRRIAFHGQPSTRYAAHLGAPAPTWKRGEGTPVKVLELDTLLRGTAPSDTSPRQIVLGEALVSTDGNRRLTVSVPSDYTVVIQTRTTEAGRSS